MSKAVVLLSGGMDSATCLVHALKMEDEVSALFIEYGQKHSKEKVMALALCAKYNVPIRIVNVGSVFGDLSCSLLKGSTDEIPKGSYAEQQREANGIVSTYVPFRNGLFLSVAAAQAYSVGASKLYIGAHADDSAGNAYPDCSLGFIQQMSQAINTGTGGKVQIVAPFVYASKKAICKVGLELGVPYEITWSCYEGRAHACGTCGTCIDRITAFKENNAIDPIEYEVEVEWNN